MNKIEKIKKEILDEYYKTGILTYTKIPLMKRIKHRLFPPKNPWLDDKNDSSIPQKSSGTNKYQSAIDKKIAESKVIEDKINELLEVLEKDKIVFAFFDRFDFHNRKPTENRKVKIRLAINLDLLELEV